LPIYKQKLELKQKL